MELRATNLVIPYGGTPCQLHLLSSAPLLAFIGQGQTSDVHFAVTAGQEHNVGRLGTNTALLDKKVTIAIVMQSYTQASPADTVSPYYCCCVLDALAVVAEMLHPSWGVAVAPTTFRSVPLQTLPKHHDACNPHTLSINSLDAAIQGATEHSF